MAEEKKTTTQSDLEKRAARDMAEPPKPPKNDSKDAGKKSGK